MFVEIVGYTKVTEQLGQLAGNGIEEVAKDLNEYIGKIIDKVYWHSGDVLKFDQDVLFCLFGDASRLENQSLEDLTLTAVQCGIGILVTSNYLIII
jgi:hypothetical protein